MMEALWESKFFVRPSECDANRVMSPTGVAERMEEAAWFHAEALGYGVRELRKMKRFWALTRLRVEFDRLPRWSEEITLHTWPKGSSGIYALRDWLWLDKEGSAFGRATSSWVLVDLEARKATALGDMPSAFEERAGIHAIESMPKKIEPLSEAASGKTFNVPLSDIDLNEHVNNTKYLRWVLDSFDRNEWKTPWTSIEANYLAETRFNESMEVQRIVNGPTHRIEVLSNKRNKPVFRAEISFQP